MKIMTGIECVRIIGQENGMSVLNDVIENSQHYIRYREDLTLAKELGINTIRIGVPWHRIEQEEGVYNWEWMDEYMKVVEELGIDAILDPLHHVSIPSWLINGFINERFVESYYRFFTHIVNRYPYVKKYTIVNEPTVTAYFAFEAGIWYPFWEMKSACGLALKNLKDIIVSCSLFLKYLKLEHWYVDSCNPSFNNNRFDFLDFVIREGAHIDVLGLDYYAHCDSFEKPHTFYNIAKEYYERYKIPIALTETNIRGFISDRQLWFKYMYEQCLRLEKEIPFKGFTWYPLIDSTDWDSLVTTSTGNIDPVGLIWLDGNYDRRISEFTQTIKSLNNGENFHVTTYDGYLPPLDEILKNFK